MVEPKIAWQSGNTRIVVWYEPFMIEEGGSVREPKPNEVPTVLRRLYVVEKVATRDALGQPNWQRIIVPNGISEISEEFLNKLGISKEKRRKRNE